VLAELCSTAKEHAVQSTQTRTWRAVCAAAPRRCESIVVSGGVDGSVSLYDLGAR